MKLKLHQEGEIQCISTLGLRNDGLPEMRLRLKDASLVDDGYCLLKTAARYMRDQACRIKPGETMSFGYWIVRFEDGGDALDVWEIDEEWRDVVPGAERALRFWHDQAEVCRSVESEFVPPLAITMALVSAGVLEGEPIEGVRYPAPPHMSGWYLTTHLYDGDFSSMKALHLYHVTAARPDLARYLALAPGHFFDFSESTDIGFSEKVAAADPDPKSPDD